MDALMTAVAALAAARTLNEVMAIVRSSARVLTHADGITFVLREGRDCYYADEDAIAPLWKGRRFPLETCISGWAMLNRQSVLIVDVFADPRIPTDAYRPTFVKSMFMTPVGDDDPVAAIGAYWASTHAATEAEQDILKALAQAAALALRNIHLDAQLRATLEREQQTRRSAEEASRLKDEFLATLSHELRTPLHVIQNWIWQLKRTLPADARLQKAVDVIERNTAMQSRLIEDLLDVSRATSGKLKVQTQLVDLAAMCAAVTEVVHLSARAKNIRVELERERSPYVWGDPDRIQQMLWNVLTNAIKFTPEDGHVLMRVSRGTRHACVVVEDNGIGVASNFLPHIFDRFRQADAGSTRRFGGLGLGLTIVKELISLHGGSVRAHSDGIGKGLKITLEFPVPAVLDQPGSWLMRRAGVELPNARLDGITVLVVDDEVEVLTSIENVLEYYGARVFTATTAAEALALLQQQHPTVLLADIAMPDRDGMELMRAIRNLPTVHAKIPAAALSAHLATEYEIDARSAGYHLYIEKPVKPEELVGRIAMLAVSDSLH